MNADVQGRARSISMLLLMGSQYIVQEHLASVTQPYFTVELGEM